MLPMRDPEQSPEGTLGVILLLAAIAALGQFSTSIYVPSIPDMAEGLATSQRWVQLTITAYLVPVALFQLVCGPLSDRFGRRPVLIGGFAIFLAGTILCIAATEIGLLIAGRVLQGIGACAGLVVSRAVARDLFEGSALVRAVSIVSVAFAVVPGITPLFGGVIQDTMGWRATFIATAIAGLIVAWITIARLGETIRTRLDRLSIRAGAAAYRPILGSGSFQIYALVSACPLMGLFAFLAGGPVFLITDQGLSPSAFGLYPPIATTGFILGSILAHRFSGQVPIDRLILAGMALTVLGAAMAVFWQAVGVLDALTVLLCMWLFLCGTGIAVPLASAAAMHLFPDRAGSASALLGFQHMSGAMLGTLAVAALIDDLGSLAFPVVMLTAGMIGLLGFLAASRALSHLSDTVEIRRLSR